MEGIGFFWNGRDSNPKFLVIDVAEGLYRVSHQSWKKDCTGCPTIVGTRQEKGKAIGICMEGGFLGEISEFLVIDAEEGLAIFTIFLILIDEFI